MSTKTAIIIGAGPAGLTAAYELLTRTDIKPIILEANPNYVGGLSKTFNYKDNRIDIGGHRFFSKSDRVMQWWLSILPKEKSTPSADPEKTDQVMLVRGRLSRIYFNKNFFPYPITLSLDVLRKLGPLAVFRIGFTYIYRRLFPIKPEKNLEDFFLNRFGDELYKTFFRSYTEKVWGLPCREISAEWGAQRIKGLSIYKVISHAISKLIPKNKDLSQKQTETSLIEQFLYPKFGPGLMWETVAKIIQERGGEIHMGEHVTGLEVNGKRIVSVSTEGINGKQNYSADYVFSTMPVKELISSIKDSVPQKVQATANGLQYRDFITVGLLLKKLAIQDPASPENRISDNWIYIHDPDVLVGRLQIFNNWSPYMPNNPDYIWLGMEYFCNEGDELWEKKDDEFIKFAIDELQSIDIIDKNEVLDSTIIRMPKTYPAYFGTYPQFNVIKDFTDKFENLFLIGRNGMHKYNNQDHSMLTAITAVNNIISGEKSKENIWNINTEGEYHEEK